MTEYTIHRAGTRGHFDYGWLSTYHTFSFSGYFNPERMNFGALRVLNDDTIEGGTGFGLHPHENMEIITIPLSGSLLHKDTMGHSEIIRSGDIQVMSAGTGIYHSEINADSAAELRLLQIWALPYKKNVVPRYEQITLNTEERLNKLQQIISPYPGGKGLWIYQHAWFHLGKFDSGVKAEYKIMEKFNGIYCFVIEGEFSIDGKLLSRRDGIGIRGAAAVSVESLAAGSEILMMEVSMG